MYHFNAFISYKHADLDNKVAESIIKDLERYRIPRKIRKSIGIKKIDRVFRDKDELPITSDLNDTISQALINSDFLIVICSTNTKKSTWVEREIEFFLQHHSINNVMTVLADGEPYDVIPKMLLSGKKEVTDENGEKKIVEIPYEPLSCDYRLPYKKAKAKELPRLVAAIIGCPYDELIDRQRQYKMKRLSAVFTGMMALSLGFAGYMYYSNTQIHKNYLESLRNQSRFLANESQKQLEKYNRIDAMELALEALPKDENDERPVTPEAQKALTDALFAYRSCEGLSVGALWNYEMPNRIDKFMVSEDRNKLAIIDTASDVCVFDTQTHEKLLELSDYEDSIDSIMFLDDNTLLVTKDHSISAYNLADGSVLWTNDDEQIQYSSRSYRFKDDEILVISADGCFTELSKKDGTIIKNHSIEDLIKEQKGASEDDFVYIYIGESALSKDCKKIAFCLTDSSDFSNEIKTINEYSFETGELVSAPIENESVTLIKYFDNNIYLSCNIDGSDGNSKYYDYTYITDSYSRIRCLASGDLSQKWEDEIVNTDITINYEFLPMDNGQMAYYEGNISKIWDNETGDVVIERRFNEPVIDISDLDGNGVPAYITYEGQIASSSTSPGHEGIDLIERFTDELVDIDYGILSYAQRYTGNEIICYGMDIHDEDWEKIETNGALNFDSTTGYCDDDVLAIMASDGADGTVVYMFDPNTRSYTGKAIVDKENRPYNYEILGSCDNKLYLIADSDRILTLIGIDANTLEVSREVLDEDDGFLDILCTLQGDKLIYCKKVDYENSLLVERDMLTKEERTFDIPYSLYDKLVYDSKSQTGFLCGQMNIIFDLAENEITPVEFDEEWGSTKRACISSDGSIIAVTNETDFKLIDKSGKVLSEFSCRNVSPKGLSFVKNSNTEEFLLVQYDNGRLLRYDASTGELVGTIETGTGNYLYETLISHADGDKYIYVSAGGAMVAINTDTWLAEIEMNNFLGHHAASDVFFSYSYANRTDETYVGFYRHYTVNELIDKAKKELHSAELSDEKKSMYGIAD